MKDRDGNEFVWVPREAVRKMLDAAHFGPNCAEDELSAKDEQFWLEVWGAMIAAAPQFVAGEVTKEMCWNVFEDCDGCEKNMAETARHWLDRWRKELGPALGLVEIREPTPEECARICNDALEQSDGVNADALGRTMFDAVSKWLKGEL